MQNELSIREVGLAQRMAIWGVISGLLAGFPPALIVVIPFQLYCYYKLARSLDLHLGIIVLCTLLMVIPLVSMLTLLILNQKATKILKNAGIRVGLMGAQKADLPIEPIGSEPIN
jgi:hypothetical protein